MMPNFHHQTDASPNLGLGLGLRSQHFSEILDNHPQVDWFEIISENFMDSGGRPRHVLREIAERYPVVMHGVSMNIGSSDPLDINYLKCLRRLADELQPAWVSDHLCWTGAISLNSHDLLPLPLTEESLKYVCQRVDQVQTFLQRPIVLENPSTYLTFTQSHIPEWEFFSALTAATGCGMLLDVNNVFVSAFNNEFDPYQYIEGLPHKSIVQMHLAGHQHCGDYIIDTHDSPVTNAVWQLFSLAWQRTQGCATCLEWDGNIPSFEVCQQELLKAKQYMGGNTTTEFKFDPIPATTRTDVAIANPLDFMLAKPNRVSTRVSK